MRPVRVSGAMGAEIEIDERGALSTPPALIEDSEVVGWAGPWPVHEHRWDTERARSGHRFQMLDAGHRAWLVFHSADGWWAEGRYR